MTAQLAARRLGTHPFDRSSPHRRNARHATLFVGSALLAVSAMLSEGSPVAAAGDGGNDYTTGLAGRVNNSTVRMDTATTITIHSPAIDPAANAPQSVRWAPILQVWTGSTWIDYGTSTYSTWKVTKYGLFGLIAPVWDDARSTILPSSTPRGTYYIRAGYVVQWLWGDGSKSTRRQMNREALTYTSVPWWGHQDQGAGYLKYIAW